MASGKYSGQTTGDQVSFSEYETEHIVAENENQFYQQYLASEAIKTSPLHIPEKVKVSVQQKNGYNQIKYQWQRGEYKYSCRWHNRTPGAPAAQGDSWVVERHRPGIGAGPNARPAKREVMIGKYKWISKDKWNAAIRAKKNGNATEKQKEILKNGHWDA